MIVWYAFRPERLFVNQRVNESLPADTGIQTASVRGPTALLEGRFHDVTHKTAGIATIYQLPDGKRALRLTNFETSNGPDVQVYLLAANDAQDNDTVKRAGFVMLGPLTGNIGDQNYDLPADGDLAKYRSATIWCGRFGVNFGTAPLGEPSGSASRAAPDAVPIVLATGGFHGVAHETKGVATAYQLPDGRRLLRLTGFKTCNGPGVRVYLVAAADAADSDSVKKAGFVSLGSLKGNVGDQNYDVPADVDLKKYQAATIWCHRFGVNFGTAPLVLQNQR